MKKIFTFVFVILLSAMFYQANAQDKQEVVTGNGIGNNIGDFTGKGPNGEMMSLSELRGKVVLVVLWNSLCGHCNTENAKYQAAYEEYKDKKFTNGDGFDVYQIALDKEEATWHEAMEKHQYPWSHHVYVIDSWKDPKIRFFGIQNLPGTFLIDENGTILDKKFPGEKIPELLDQYLKN